MTVQICMIIHHEWSWCLFWMGCSVGEGLLGYPTQTDTCSTFHSLFYCIRENGTRHGIMGILFIERYSTACDRVYACRECCSGENQKWNLFCDCENSSNIVHIASPSDIVSKVCFETLETVVLFLQGAIVLNTRVSLLYRDFTVAMVLHISLMLPLTWRLVNQQREIWQVALTLSGMCFAFVVTHQSDGSMCKHTILPRNTKLANFAWKETDLWAFLPPQGTRILSAVPSQLSRGMLWFSPFREEGMNRRHVHQPREILILRYASISWKEIFFPSVWWGFFLSFQKSHYCILRSCIFFFSSSFSKSSSFSWAVFVSCHVSTSAHTAWDAHPLSPPDILFGWE